MSQYRKYGEGDEPQGAEGDSKFTGVNCRLHPEELGTGLVAAGYNVRMRDGSVATRQGMAKPGWLNVVSLGNTRTNPVGELNGAGIWQDPNGLEWVLIAADGVIYRHRPNNFRKALGIPAGVAIRGRVTFCAAFDRVYCFRGRHLAPLVMDDIDAGFKDLVQHWSATEAYDADVTAAGQTAEEVAYGPFVSCGITSSGLTATVTTATAHEYVTGADITIRGASPAGYNGRWPITVTGTQTFTYQLAAALTSPATGTPTCSNMEQYWRALLPATFTGVKLTRAASVYTVSGTTTAAHGLVTGDWVTVTNVDASYGFNGTWQVTVPSGSGIKTFTFTCLTSAAASVTTSNATLSASKTTVGVAPVAGGTEWERVWNVLPNADEGVFVNNRMLVPTAYTPGDESYDAASSYTKRDFVVIMDIGDPVHFIFYNELRINQGSADEIEQVLKFNANTVAVMKGGSWGLLTGVTWDLSGLTLDMRMGRGVCCPGAAVVTGANVLYMSPGVGVCGLRQNELGQTVEVDVPFSNEFQEEIKRINWAAMDKIRLAYWNDRLYCAVPIDGAKENNAVLVYDFRRESGSTVWAGKDQVGQWEGVDTGPAMKVKEWFTCHIHGELRLCCIDGNGYGNVMEETWQGDQMWDADAATGLAWEDFDWRIETRGYGFGSDDLKRFKRVLISMDWWGATLSVAARTGVAGASQVLRDELELSRTAYLKPVGRPAYDLGNAAGDWSEGGRGDYSIPLAAGGVRMTGLRPGQYQEVTVRSSARTLAGRYVQYEIWGSGRVRVHAIEPAASAGARRAGVMV